MVYAHLILFPPRNGNLRLKILVVLPVETKTWKRIRYLPGTQSRLTCTDPLHSSGRFSHFWLLYRPVCASNRFRQILVKMTVAGGEHVTPIPPCTLPLKALMMPVQLQYVICLPSGSKALMGFWPA
jgi:hypothetical protein